MSAELWVAFTLTLLAGISTGIGSAIAFFAKRSNTKFLSISLGFSAGVMIYVSFVELFASSIQILVTEYGKGKGTSYATLAFFAGIILILIIDRLIPQVDAPKLDSSKNKNAESIKPKLLRVGLVTALVLAIHNFPEGMVTFLVALKDPQLAIPIAIAIAIHNIPEGISVSVPIYYATGNRRKAFWISFLSGLAEPVGAAVGYLLLAPFLNDTIYGIIFAMIAGIMVFISLDELMPAAEEYGSHNQAIYGLVLGMAVMALSLVMLG